MAKLTFLSPNDRIYHKVTKHFNSAHPSGFTTLNRILNWTSSEVETFTLLDTLTALQAHAELGNVLLTGEVSTPLVNKRRAGKAVGTASHTFLLDLDGIPMPPKEFIAQVPWLNNTSYILKASASQGVFNTAKNEQVKPGYRYHVLFQSETPITFNTQMYLIKFLNHTYLRQALQLHPRGLALDYLIDPAMARPHSLVTLADPTVEPPFTNTLEERFELVESENQFFDATTGPAFKDLQKADTELQGLVAELRGQVGLSTPAKNRRTKKVNKVIEVQADPIPGKLQFLDSNNGHCHYNFEGGDSGSYWHPIDQPEIIQTFKNPEIKYLHADLDPESYALAQTRRIKHIVEAKKEKRFVAIDIRTAKTHGVRHIPENNDLIVTAPMPNSTATQNWCTTSDIIVPDKLPELEIIFDPYNREILRHDGKQGFIANEYREPKFMTEFSLETNAPDFHKDNICEYVHENMPTLYDLMYKVHGNDHESVNYMLNWLHYIVTPVGRRPIVALVMHGQKGSGKNLLIERVLKPMVGSRYVVSGTKKTLTSRFNAELKQALLLVFSELHLQRKETEAIDILKAYITDPKVSMEQKFKDKVGEGVSAFFGTIIFGNDRGFLSLEEGDRRFRVSPRQERKIIDTGVNEIGLNEEHDGKNILDYRLHQEAVHLAKILFNYQGDYDYLLEEQRTDAGRTLQVEAQTSIDKFMEAINNGDLDYFFKKANSSRYEYDHMTKLFTKQDINIILMNYLSSMENKFYKNDFYALDEIMGLYVEVHRKPIELDAFIPMCHKYLTVMSDVKTDKGPRDGVMICWIPSDKVAVEISGHTKTHKTITDVQRIKQEYLQ